MSNNPETPNFNNNTANWQNMPRFKPELSKAEKNKKIETEVMHKMMQSKGVSDENFSERKFYKALAAGSFSNADMVNFVLNTETPKIEDAIRNFGDDGGDPAAHINKIDALIAMLGRDPNGAAKMYSQFDVKNLRDQCKNVADFERRVRDVQFDVPRSGFDALRNAMYGDQSEYTFALQRIIDKQNTVLDNIEKKPLWENMDSPKRLFKDAAVASISKNQVEQNMVIAEKEDGTSCDAAYGNGNDNVFAVFDGDDGPDGRTAARGCMENMEDVMKNFDFTTAEGKAGVMFTLAQNIQRGATTGLVTKIVEGENGKMLHYAAVGKSKLYVIHQGYAAQCPDATTPGTLNNAEPVLFNNDNIGAVPLSDGDQIVLCTYGFRGNPAPNDFRINSDVTNLAYSHPDSNGRPTRDAKTSVTNLMYSSNADADRTAMVINV